MVLLPMKLKFIQASEQHTFPFHQTLQIVIYFYVLVRIKIQLTFLELLPTR